MFIYLFLCFFINFQTNSDVLVGKKIKITQEDVENMSKKSVLGFKSYDDAIMLAKLFCILSESYDQLNSVQNFEVVVQICEQFLNSQIMQGINNDDFDEFFNYLTYLNKFDGFDVNEIFIPFNSENKEKMLKEAEAIANEIKKDANCFKNYVKNSRSFSKINNGRVGVIFPQLCFSSEKAAKFGKIASEKVVIIEEKSGYRIYVLNNLFKKITNFDAALPNFIKMQSYVFLNMINKYVEVKEI